MKDLDKKIREASAEYVNRVFGNDASEDYSEDMINNVQKLLQEEKTMTKTKGRNRISRTVLLCAAMLAFTVFVCAAGPRIAEYINMTFLRDDSAEQLTEIPEGYIGIYTAEDLNHIRDDLDGNYIMMNDIFITDADYAEGGVFEDGFEPIGSYSAPFRGIFNGNGYVIENLVIDVNAKDNLSVGAPSYNRVALGLFGRVQRRSERIYAEETVEEADMDINGDGVLDTVIIRNEGEVIDSYMKGGIVKNLGLVNGSLTVTKDHAADLLAGAIAGYADFVVGCFTENFDVTVINNTSSADFSIGGIVGIAEYADSCYTDADITYTLNLPDGEIYTSANTSDPFIGGVAGQSYACVTSYFAGTIQADDPVIQNTGYEYRQTSEHSAVYEPEIYESYTNIDGVANIPEGAVPAILNGVILDKITAELDEWSGMKFNAFYVQGDYRELDIAPSNYTTDNTDTVFYVLDPEVKVRELRELSRLLKTAFENDDFEEFCRENNVKYGKYYCYDLSVEQDCTFTGFDFDSIWTKYETGNPSLRLFG